MLSMEDYFHMGAGWGYIAEIVGQTAKES